MGRCCGDDHDAAVALSALIICLCCVLPAVVILPIIGFIYLPNDDYPEFRVVSVTTTTPFTLNTTGNSSIISNNSDMNMVDNANITAGFNITFWVGKPYIGYIYGPNGANVSVNYHHSMEEDDDKQQQPAAFDYYLSSSSFKSLCPGRSCIEDDVESWVPVTVNVVSMPSDVFTASLMARDLQRGSMNLTVKVTADYRDRKNDEEKLKITVVCKDIKVGVPTGIMLSPQRPCNVKLH